MLVNVVGYIWQGNKSSYTYRHTGSNIPTPMEVKRLAGDFSHVEDFQCVKISVKNKQLKNGIRTIKDQVVAKDWNSAESADFFEESQNG